MDALAPGSTRGSSHASSCGPTRRLTTAAPVVLAVAMALLAVPAASLCAQDEAVAVAPPDHRVRASVVTPSGDAARYVGMASLRADTLTLLDDSGLRAIPVATIRQLELSRGRRGNGTMGALLGAGVGFAAGLDAAPDGGGEGSISGEVLMIPLLTIVWSGLGYFIGTKIRTERWQEIPLDRLLEP